MNSLEQVRLSNYTHEDQVRDFKKVFFGSEEGKRVLSQIYGMCEGPMIRPEKAESAQYLAFRHGMKWISNLITQCFVEKQETQVEDHSYGREQQHY